MTELRLHTLLTCETVVLGGNIAGLACAVERAGQGERVLLMERGTCLYRDMDRSARYDASPDRTISLCDKLFPAHCLAEDGTFHPDSLKRHGEALAEKTGIRLLYGADAVHFDGRAAVIAHKSGLYAVACEKVYDCRAMDGVTSRAEQSYALHMLDGDRHIVLHVPIRGEEPHAACYAQALEAFARAKAENPALTLARSGVTCAPKDGIDANAAVRAGLACTPGFTNTPDTGSDLPALFFENPLYPNRDTPATMPPVCSEETADVIVVGGGTAGAVAALSAARQGAKVLLLEMNALLGGTATVGGVSIYWFGTRDGATQLIDNRVDALYRSLSLPRKKCLWSDHDVFLPDLKAHALHQLLKEAGVAIAFEATACAAIKNGESVAGVAYAQGGKFRLARAPMVIDATGDADIAMFAGARHTYGGEDNVLTFWGSLAQYTTPASYRNNFSTMAHIGCPLDTTRFIIAGRLRGNRLYDHGGYVALRESRHIKSMDDVMLEALLSLREPRDTLCQCFSNYDPKGKLTAKIVYNGLLPPNLLMNVPRGAVIPLGADGKPMRGILVGGKAIGCTHDAFPGLRMQPDLQQQGFALGVLAAETIRQGVPAWEAGGVEAAILRAGGQTIHPLGKPIALPAKAVQAIDDATAMEWLDMDPTAHMAEQPPVIACFLADTRAILPHLKAAHEAAPEGSAKRLTLARLLLWHGDASGAADVIAAIRALLAQTDGLPKRNGSVTFGQLLPDHGLMPEAVYLLNALGHVQTPVTALFQEVLERLTRIRRDYRDLRAGVYCYVECFAYVATMRRDPAFAPMLKRLLALPEFSRGEDDPLLAERYAMLLLAIGRALWTLGDPSGSETLRALRNHPSAAIRLSAQADFARDFRDDRDACRKP